MMAIQSMLSGWIRRKWREVIPVTGLLQRLFSLILNINTCDGLTPGWHT